MELLIERAVPDDASALTQLAFNSKASNGYDDAFMEQCRVELAVTGDMIAGGEFWKAVASGGSQPLGFFGLGIAGQVAEVHGFYISPAHKRAGIGSALWTTLVNRAGRLGAETIVLDADPAAVAFYETKGLTICGQSPSGSIPGRKLPQMQISLE